MAQGQVLGSNRAVQIWTRGAHVGSIHYICSNRIIRNGSGLLPYPLSPPCSVGCVGPTQRAELDWLSGARLEEVGGLQCQSWPPNEHNLVVGFNVQGQFFRHNNNKRLRPVIGEVLGHSRLRS